MPGEPHREGGFKTSRGSSERGKKAKGFDREVLFRKGTWVHAGQGEE